MIPPFGTTVVKGIVYLTMHSKCLSVVVESVAGYSEHISMARSFWVLPGKSKIDVCLRNKGVQQVTIPKWTVVGETLANIIPALLVPKPTGHGQMKRKPL